MKLASLIQKAFKNQLQLTRKLVKEQNNLRNSQDWGKDCQFERLELHLTVVLIMGRRKHQALNQIIKKKKSFESEQKPTHEYNETNFQPLPYL